MCPPNYNLIKHSMSLMALLAISCILLYQLAAVMMFAAIDGRLKAFAGGTNKLDHVSR